jgi:hypothetical protein
MPKTLDSLPVSGDANLMIPVHAGNLDSVADASLRARAAEALKAGKVVWTNARGFLRVDDPRHPDNSPPPASTKLRGDGWAPGFGHV